MDAQTTEEQEKGPVNPLAMSDEDFLKQPLPGSELPVSKTQEELDAEAAAQAAAQSEAEVAAAAQVEAAATSASGKQTLDGGNVPTNPEVIQDGKTPTSTASAASTGSTEPGKEGTQKADPKAATPAADKPAEGTQVTAVDYEQFYKQVMAPFKANGKQIELRTPDEAIQLMQMGANYTRKMQDIQPHRKTLLMLENNGLLDADKLSLLIDVDKGNPEAIRKLLKDRGVDPLSLDTSEDSNYLGGNHKVSDEEANFRTALSDLGSHDEGKQTLQAINSTWDQASKEVLWKEPNLLSVMHSQRENGIYDRIATEVNRLQALGQIPAGTPFIHAYKAVGDALQAQGRFNDLVSAVPGTPAGSASVATAAAAQPVATRVVAPKSAVTNGDLASAAAASRSTPGKVEKVVNPLAMSDDDFLKQMANRV
jgi:hypothetical protein